MKPNDREKTQGFLLYGLKSYSEIIGRQQRWELRSLYLTENIWKSHINTADKDVNMKVILTVINIT